MTDRVVRELLLDAPADQVWEAVTADGWLADEVSFELRPGGDAYFRSAEEVKTGWIEEVSAPTRLTFWWTADGEPSSRVELTLAQEHQRTRLRVVETRPLELLDLLGTPLPGAGGHSYGPAMLAA